MSVIAPLAPPAAPLAAAPSRRPAHVAIIMDGNGRWAEARGLPRIAGHRAGAQAARRTIEQALEHGVPWLTLYAFSSENWRRPAEEVTDLTGLLRHYLRNEIKELAANGVRLRVIGEAHRFPPDVQALIAEAIERTRRNHRLNLTIALSYGGRGEILAAVRRAAELVRAGELAPEAIDEETFGQFLFTGEMPDPDLIIRTSGERRLSNFLLWQAAYAELVFLDVLWPDFDACHFAAALADFARRERRFGARPG
jgi:undecaprenyl diphosphate synthase